MYCSYCSTLLQERRLTKTSSSSSNSRSSNSRSRSQDRYVIHLTNHDPRALMCGEDIGEFVRSEYGVLVIVEDDSSTGKSRSRGTSGSQSGRRSYYYPHGGYRTIKIDGYNCADDWDFVVSEVDFDSSSVSRSSSRSSSSHSKSRTASVKTPKVKSVKTPTTGTAPV